MARIFLSYSREDDELASAVSSGLVRRRHEIVGGVASVMLGQNLRDSITSAIQSADAVVALISRSSLQSPWVLSEIVAAMGYASKSFRLQVIPIVVDETSLASLPAEISSIQVLSVPDGDVATIVDKIDTIVALFVGQRAAVQDAEDKQRQRIERNAADYVTEAVESQRTAEKRYRIAGQAWYAVGLVALATGLAFVAIALFNVRVPSAEWTTFALIGLRTLVVIALLGACAKYAFSLGRSFTIESLKCADRLHAISFGQFYLRAYGEKAQWHDLKEAFANWNIDRPSAFVSTS